VQITTLASDGTVEYDTDGFNNWAAVAVNDIISAADIAAGRLRFVPDADENGSPYATIGFKVGDGTDFSVAAYTLTVNVTALNDAPVITSNGGGAAAALAIDENTSAVATVTSSDVDGGAPAYSISGGADQLLFNIDAVTGVLSFNADPDFETPLDAGADNVYDVQVRVDDGAGGFDVQDISVAINDIANTLVVTTELDVVDAVDFSSAEALNANKGADGEVSLAEAIFAANGDATLDTITFNIGGGGPFTITPDLGGLPAIVNPVVIDATTQPGWSGVPIIELDGSAAGAVHGFFLDTGSDGSTIRGFVINRFQGSGIVVASSNNTIQGNYIGTDVTGTFGLGNQNEGVFLTNFSTGNLVGGSTAAERNVISGNTFAGVFIVNSDNNFVRGNYIGTNAAGDAPIANGLDGIEIVDSVGNIIGGSTLLDQGNVISGNSEDGVSIWGGLSTGNRVLGNFIGTDSTGTAKIENQWNGVAIQFDANRNVVGSGAADEGNVISGNTLNGVYINFASNNSVQGNYIGVDATGLAPLGNEQDGVRIDEGTDNIIGGINPGEENVISGNWSDGVSIVGATSLGNRIEGNIIGLNKDADAKIGNLDDGVDITDAANNFIGGSVLGAGNIISGNNEDGIKIEGPIATDNQILGNIIGTNLNSDADLGNTGDGVKIELGASGNIIGGPGANERNIISGNDGPDSDGIEIVGIATASNVIQGNYIGVDITGTAPLGNSDDGIVIIDSPDNIIGGSGTDEGNVLSGNADEGISIEGVGSTGNIVQGNLIGSNAAGDGSVANLDDGLSIIAGASLNVIGGTASGEGNVISGNAFDGVRIADSDNNTLQGNIIGLDINGTDLVANGGEGVYITRSSSNTIGGGASGAGNVISGNLNNGLVITGASTDNRVRGNFIGTDITGTVITDPTGTVAIGNGNEGVTVRNGAFGNFIGGSNSGEGNVISGNISDGIYISNSNSNVVQGNYVGLDQSGLVALGNLDDGIQISDGADNVIGGTVAGARNVIAGSVELGVDISGILSTGNKVQGNYIGTDKDGAFVVGGSNDVGIGISVDASNNLIGGTDPNASNLIAFSTTTGVEVSGGTDNAILGNVMRSNTDLGIDLNDDGVTPNDLGVEDADGGANDSQNYPRLWSANTNGVDTVVMVGNLDSTPNTTFRIEFFANPIGGGHLSGHGEADSFLGAISVTTDGSGNAFFSEPLTGVAVAQDEVITATATVDSSGTFGPTSEFAANITAVLNELPVAQDDAFTILEDTTLNANVLSDNGSGSDFDPDLLDILTAKLVSGPSNALSFALLPDGSFDYTPATDFNGVDSFTYIVDDGTAPSNVATVTITVDPDNDAPINNVPAAPQSTNEDTALVFSAGTSNPISVGDVDAGAGLLQVTLNAANGTLSLNGTTGLTVTGGADSTASVTFTGTLTDINNALDGLAFDPTPNFNGSASIEIITDDQGNSGAGGALGDSDLVAITVNQVNDPATFGGNTSGVGDEDAGPIAGALTVSDAVDGMITTGRTRSR
jgi:parallel beta-helix repeat protein